MEQVKIIQCLSPEGRKKTMYCVECYDKNRCATVKPELALLVDKNEKSGSISELTEEDMSLIQTKYPKALEFDKEEDFYSWYEVPGSKRIKTAQCLSSKKSGTNELCEVCRDRECCLTINPELASLVKKRETADGTHEFTLEDIAYLHEKYPTALSFNYEEDCGWAVSTRDWLLESYYNDDYIHDILDDSIAKKLEYDAYSETEMVALYEWAIKRLRIWVEL